MKKITSFLFAFVLALSPAIPAFASVGVVAAASCPVFTRDLSMGVNDTATLKDVTALQVFLSNAGYLTASSTGTFGPKTLAAVQTFQRANGLNAQGFFGARTREAMQKKGCVTESAMNQELSFVALDTPDELTRGNESTWILQFSPRTIAPNTLKYSVAWGDGATSTGPVVTTAGSATTTLAFFAHAFEKTGSYRTVITVTPPQGEPLIVRTSSHVMAR